MGDLNAIVGKINSFAAKVSDFANALQGQIPAASSPSSATMTPDQLKLSTPVQPQTTVVSAQSSGGVMGVIKNLWEGVVSFFKRLFGGKADGITPSATTWPAVNQDAREQLFTMFPTGRAFYTFIPITATREANTISVSAAGFANAKVTRQNGELYYTVNDEAPVRVSQVTSNRSANGDTHFDITLDGGRTVSADILADGRTVRYGEYSLTLS